MNFEKIYQELIRIYAEQESLKIIAKIERKWQKMTKEQKIYCKIGQAVCKTLGFMTITGIFTAIGIGFFM